ncbi:MAG: pitrilysin family protein [Gemmatales bacterium]|nr:insulinase family protein [Gemmatales bacterium]MDW7995065.1 pitrilysin family protein [Gemmatales bacterium]
MAEVYHTTWPNGLTLLVEEMPEVRTAALSIWVPAGHVYDPPQRLGTANVLSELIMRGAGPRDSRRLLLDLDALGVDHGETAGSFHMSFRAGTIADNLIPALRIFADIVRRPHLPEKEFPAVKELALGELDSLEDEPREKLLVELARHYYPPPLGNDHRGEREHIESLTLEEVRQFYQQTFRPQGTIISVAGRVNWSEIRAVVEELFADWTNAAEPTWQLGPEPEHRAHLTRPTQQTQIGVAYASVPFGQDDHYAARAAVAVLSGGMSSRLFTEVREKRGLCYAVWASYHSFKDRASVFCYAGTTAERAQETLEVLLAELRRLPEGVSADEVQRVQAGLKSALIMHQESASARAASIASDWYFLGRVRSLDEIQHEIDTLTPQRIVEHLRHYPPRNFTIVTLGPKPLHIPEDLAN